ncbi:hypothetical protein ANCCAN_06691 [Ancylostoma caninum]|uniref:Uncharacterized protein n=1 Tax=Ancylostoma caninum TaxID=29170 RepID=A0A368GV90_ANCCA|nr:hypothetical protein ANCCAN_06691 [Ancylostoma caninum]
MSGIPPRRLRDEQQPSTSGTHRDPGKKSKKRRSGTKKEVLVPNTAHVACELLSRVTSRYEPDPFPLTTSKRIFAASLRDATSAPVPSSPRHHLPSSSSQSQMSSSASSASGTAKQPEPSDNRG